MTRLQLADDNLVASKVFGSNAVRVEIYGTDSEIGTFTATELTADEAKTLAEWLLAAVALKGCA